MTPREELEALRRMHELEAKASGQPDSRQPTYRSPADLREQAARYDRDHNPTMEGIPWHQRLSEGISKSVVDTGLGIGQLAGLVDQDTVNQHARQDDPLMRTGWGTSGNVVGQVAQMAAPMGEGAKAFSLLGKYAPTGRAAWQAGAFSGLQPVHEGESRLGNAAVGAMFGAGGERILAGSKAIASGVASRLEGPAKELAARARDFGIPLSMSDLSQNSLVRTAASQMERLPFSGASKARTAQQEALNRAVGKTFGLDEARITPDVFAKQKVMIGQAIDTIASRNEMGLTPQAMSKFGQIRAEAQRLGGPEAAKRVEAWIAELTSKVGPNGKVPGKAYQSFDSRLGQEIRGGQGEMKHYLGQLRDIARQAMDASISPRDAKAWAAARQMYANLKTVEPLVAKSEGGNISAAALMGRVTATNAGKVRMATGKGGDLGDLAQIGQRFLKPSPNSGTADRALVNAAVAGVGIPGLYGAQHYGLIDPETAVGIGGLLLGNRAGLGVLNSKALTQGGSRTLNGLARLVETSQPQRALPAVVPPLLARKQKKKQP